MRYWNQNTEHVVIESIVNQENMKRRHNVDLMLGGGADGVP